MSTTTKARPVAARQIVPGRASASHSLKALALYASIIGRQAGVQIVFGNYPTAATDGKKIYLPTLVNVADASWIVILRALIDHEVMHVRQTKFETIKDCNSPLSKILSNILEDCWGEREQSKVYPGSLRSIRAGMDELVKLRWFIPPPLDGSPIDPRNAFVSWLLHDLRGRHFAMPELSDWALQWRAIAEPAFGSQLLDVVLQKMHEVDTCKSSAQAVSIANQVVELLRKQQREKEQQAQQQQAERDQQEQDQGEQSSQQQQAQPDQQAQAGAADQAEEGQGEAAAEEQGAGGGGSGADSDTEGGAGSDAVDSDSGSADADAEAAAGTDAGEDAGDPTSAGGEPDSGSQEPGQEAQDPQGSQADGEGQSSQQSTDDVSQQDGGESRRGRASSDPQQDAEDDARTSTSDDRTGGTQGSNTSKASGDVQASDQDSSGIGAGSGWTETPEELQEQARRIGEILAASLEELPVTEMADAICEQLKEAAIMLPGSGARDVDHADALSQPNWGLPGTRETLESDAGEQEVRALAKTIERHLGSKLRDMLEARVQCSTSYSRRGLRVGAQKLSRAKTGSLGVFRKTEEGDELSTAISLLVDMSGSMSANFGQSTRRVGAAGAAYAVADTLGKFAVPFSWVNFGSSANSVKTFGEAWRKRRSACTTSELGGTVMDTPLLRLVPELAARDEERKLFLVITDGEPSGVDEVVAVLTLMPMMGIEVAMLFIGHGGRELEGKLAEHGIKVARAHQPEALTAGLFEAVENAFL